MRRLVFIILALATLLPSLAFGYDVLVLQSRRDPGFEEVVKGFHTGRNPSERLIVLSDYAEVDITRILREDRPKVVLAIGDTALTMSRKIQNTPVIAVMALGIHTRNGLQPNLSGIGMFAPPERYIEMFRTMKTRRVGVIYNPAKTGWYMKLARQAAADSGIELVPREASAPREAMEKLTALDGKVDALWMLPDSSVITRETTEAYFRFGQQHTIPVVSFSANYLGLGAVAVLDIDRFELGRQADTMINELLKGTGINTMPLSFPTNLRVKTNTNVLKNFGSLFK